MDKSGNRRPTQSQLRQAVLELDDQTKRAAILEVARRLEWVREQTSAYKKTRRAPRATPTTTKESDDVM
jgi:hypothetical protein